MAEVKPFKGIRYNNEKFSDMEKLVTPPYDVIDSAAQEAYYQKHKNNIIRLELGKVEASDTPTDNRYTRSETFFNEWLDKNVLVKEDKPAFYFYEQTFTVEEQQYTRSGIICRVHLEEYEKDTILPHEETLPKAKQDRLELLQQCKANFSPIFGLYMDPEEQLNKLLTDIKNSTAPELDFTDESNNHHAVWVIKDMEINSKIESVFEDKKIYIADGHHRYETALEYSRQMKDKGCPGSEYAMMTLVNIYDPGLIVLPTHRCVHNIENFNPDEFLQQLKDNFKLKSFEFSKLTETPGELSSVADAVNIELQKDGNDKHKFAVYLGDESVHFISVQKDDNIIDSAKSKAWNSLDITVMQKLLLQDLLGIGDKERAEGNMITYVKDSMQTLEKVKQGDYQAAFLVNPTKVEEVIEVSLAGNKMPQKSTFFYPKLITGLVINSIE